MSRRSIRTSTALVATLSLVVPQGVFVLPAQAQETVLLCLSQTAPPCPEGEPAEGTPHIVNDDGTVTLAQGADDAADAQAEAEAAAQAESEAAAQAQADADAAAEAEAATAAQAEADAAAALEAEAEAAAAAEAAAQADADAAAQVQADEEAAAAAQAQADADAAAQAQADAEAQAQDDAAAAAQAQADADAAASEAAQAEADAVAAAQAEAEEQAAADAQAAAEGAAQAEADAEAAAQADADAAAQAQIEADAAAQAQADAEADEAAADTAAADAEQAESDAQAQADVDAATAADAQAQSDADAAAVAQDEADAAAAAADEGQVEATDQAEVDAAEAADQAEADAAAQAESDAAAQEEADAAAQAEADAAAQSDDATAQAEADAALQAEADAAAQAELDAEAAAAQAEIDAGAAADALDEAVAETAPEDLVDPTVDADVPAVAAAAEADAEAPADAVVETIEVEEARSSDQDFATTVTGEAQDAAAAASSETTANNDDDNDDGLSNFEKALLVGLGAVAVGAVLRNGNEVVSNSGDRVVTRDERGDLTIYRDDDALLRQPGTTVRTETFNDGSTRTFLDREDGTQVVTIRDAEGRVLRRSRVFADGTQVELFDDLAPAEPVNVMSLVEQAPPPVLISASSINRDDLRAALAREPTYDTGRTYSLRQVREIAAVRNLVTGIDLDAVTFPSGSAAIPSEQLVNLVEMGVLIEELLADNPQEVFLIEGHTDAVGTDSSNLALSDRRAETVALALTENFAIAPENLVVQGYGERYLRVATEASEEANRRATVRRITPLLNVVASNQ